MVPKVSRRTVAPLFLFESASLGVEKLDADILLRDTDHTNLKYAIDEYFAASGFPNENFMTYLSPHERGWFEAASFCVEHRFEVPYGVNATEYEEQSRKIVESVVIGMRVVKSTLVKPVLYLDWDDSGIGKLVGFRKGGFDIYRAPDERFEDFEATDVASLATLMPRVRQAIMTHTWGPFNRVANALNFYETGYRMNSGEMRFILFATSLESLFVTSNRGVSRQFRERISRFLAQAPPEQQKLENICRAIYNLRSSIVHGQAFDGAGRPSFDRLMFEIQEIGRRSLRKVLWNDILFATFQGSAVDLGHFLEQL